MALLQRPDACLTIAFEHLVSLLLAEQSQLFIVQIGAFDGQTGDQIHDYIKKYGWRGVLVEPQPRYFERLVSTYAGVEGLHLHNVAVADKRESRTLYAVREDLTGLPSWAPQTASFDRYQLEHHGFDDDVIEHYDVQCVPLCELLADINCVDILQVDVEGFDAEIIRMFDFDVFRPRIVRFESAHLSRSDHNLAIKRLVGYGYQVAVTGMDTIGWHP